MKCLVARIQHSLVDGVSNYVVMKNGLLDFILEGRFKIIAW